MLANIDADRRAEAGLVSAPRWATRMQFYKDIPLTSMPYGQSLAVIALAEFLRTYI